MNFKLKKKWIYFGILVICVAIIIFSLLKIFQYNNKVNLDKNEFDSLKNLIGENNYSPMASVDSNEYIWGRDDENDLNEIVAGEIINDYEITDDGDYIVPGIVEENPAIEEPEPNVPEVIKDYTSLKKLNYDFVGWLNIEGTLLDYPVVQTNNNPDYYLRKNFYKKYSTLGTPYAEEGCEVDKPSDNITIYGHNIKDGSMFGSLINYLDKDYYEKHKYITFDTLEYFGKYEIIAVYKSAVYTGKEDEFKYWNFINAESEDEYNAFIEKIKGLSVYDISTTAEYGDKLISLSTCEYSQKNGRLIIVAKLIDKELKG